MQPPLSSPTASSSSTTTSYVHPNRTNGHVRSPSYTSDLKHQHQQQQYLNQAQSSGADTAASTASGSGTGDISLYDDFLNKIQGSPSWPADKEAIILEPFSYLVAVPGKDMRALLIDAFNVWLKVPPESIEIVKNVVGQLHTASLLMDDVEDDSQLRRGIPVAHKLFGIPQTINTANYVYFLAYQQLSSLQSLAQGGANLLEIVNEELLNLHRGQGMDLYWRDSLTCPTEQEYIDMVSNKTGGLFRIAIRLMEATSSQPDKGAYVPLVNLIGIFFQIADDYLNLQSDAYKQNKGFCEDLTEGKFSFPIVHSIRTDTSNQRMLNVLRQRPTDDSIKAYAVSYMNDKTRSFEYTREVLKRLEKQARDEIERLGGNVGLSKFLDKMSVPDPLEVGGSSSSTSGPGEVASP